MNFVLIKFKIAEIKIRKCMEFLTTGVKEMWMDLTLLIDYCDTFFNWLLGSPFLSHKNLFS